MKSKREHIARYVCLGGMFIAACLIFIARLISIQIAGQDYYSVATGDNNYTRTVAIQAQRGEIFDRNGNALVTNSYTYDIYLDAGSIGSTGAEKNAVLLKVVSVAKECGEGATFTCPQDPFVKNGEEYALDSEYMGTVYGRRLSNLMVQLGYTQNEDGTWPAELDVADVRRTLLVRYAVTDADGVLQYSEDEAELLFCLRLDMEVHNFSASEPYTILTDISVKLISTLLEGTMRGVQVSCAAERVYMYPGVASHIIGRVGRITADNAEFYTEQGYALDAIVGTSGAEQAFESYLRGTDGELTIVEDEYGNVVEQYISTEPVPGQDVYLTMDINLQKAAETALADNIAMIVSNAEAEGDELSGEDANAGALTAVDAKTGEVLALASYPTYDLSTFNDHYQELNEDPDSPLFFRALEGTYAPGSTFKPGVATAALQERIITTATEIQDKGEYDYYDDYKPRCWIYSAKYGWQNHGMVNVSKAIQVSCNYFFYDVGRQLTISKMNEYCKKYGLGQPTGIELTEKTGVLAGPAEREESGQTWYDGDTLQAAIGQSDNLFTPLQISCYISTIINGGNRLGAHMLYQVKDFDGTTTYQSEAKIVDSVAIDSNIVSTIKYAMKDVTENGSAARVFVNYGITIGGKTGTAQVSTTSSDNAVFTAFAPFDDPSIVATCVIEHGASGTDAGFAIRDVFDIYFGLDKAGADDGASDTAAAN